MADAAIVCGVTLLTYVLWEEEERFEANQATPSASHQPPALNPDKDERSQTTAATPAISLGQSQTSGSSAP